MNLQDKIENKLQDVSGKGKEAAGDATGNDGLKAEGQGDQAKSSLKDGAEKVKDAAGDIKDGLTK